MANNRDHDMDDMNESYEDSNSSQDYNYDSTDSSYESQDSYQDDYATTDTQYQDYQDFDDHTTNQDDSEWDEGNFDSTEPLAPPESTKKKSLALIAAIAVVILGGGAFLFFKSPRTSLPPTPATEENTASNLSQSPTTSSGETVPATSSNPASITPPQPQPVASSPEQAGGPLLPEPPMDDNAGKDLPIPNEVKVSSPETSAQPIIADAAKTDAAKPLVPFQPTSDFPSVNDIKKPDEQKPVLNDAHPLDKVPTQAVTAEPLKEMAPVLSENTPPTASQPTDSQPITSNPVPAPVSSAATEELAQSKKTIETLKSELDTQKKAAQASQSQVDELKGQIASLQADLARANEKKLSASSATDPVITERTTSSASENKKPAATHVERVKKSPSSPSRPKTQISQSQERSTARVAGSNKWVLKGAQSGQAILGSLGHDDLRTVTVGETVSGLGRITSIERTASGWVVQGTLGSISQ